MNLDELTGKSILLLGKSRALEPEEFTTQLKAHNIMRADTFSDEVAVIIEGRMINPIEQEQMAELYAAQAAPIISVDELEAALCESIDGNKLMMSLKLSGDRERLLGYLQNPLIENALFLKLLGLYNWQGEGFFENDENRDVTAALISRYYENIERNHNVQYANMGVMHLINQTHESDLIESIAMLAPLQEALKKGCDNSTKKILYAIARHPDTEEKMLKNFVRSGDQELKVIIAQREGLSDTIQQLLYESGDRVAHEALSFNPSLASSLIDELMELFGENIAASLRLDETRFERLVESNTLALAENPSLDYAMQRKIFCYADDVQAILAQNRGLDERMIQILYETNKPMTLEALAANVSTPGEMLKKLIWNKKLHPLLAGNTSTPAEVLKELFATSEHEVLEALAQNSMTPTDLLYQLQVDQRYARHVMENPGFGEHIQRENIGWMV
ncbi:MAG: hypothetical protein U9Q62_10205 [Campylobacterota bacterium]|nr:hypothetical protein [Campylobacterota bacterium]